MITNAISRIYTSNLVIKNKCFVLHLWLFNISNTIYGFTRMLGYKAMHNSSFRPKHAKGEKINFK